MSYSYLRDVAERVGATFAEAFLGAFVLTSVSDVSVDNVEKAAFAGAVAALALVKSLVAQATGKYRSASVID